MVRKAIEMTYIGKCTITEYQPYKKENRSTGHQEVIVLENQPCKLSFSSIGTASEQETVTELGQIVKVFLAPEIQVKPGSKLTILQNGVTTEYKNSGEPARYSSHQEVMLELFKGWA